MSDSGRQPGECRHGEHRGRCEWCVKQTGGIMQSEVRKVLERERETWGETSFWGKIDAAERADASRHEEPVQAMRKVVAELVARWSTHYVPIDAAVMVRRLLAELNAIIATKTDTAESRQATASWPVHVDWPPSWVTAQQWKEKQAGESPKLTMPAGTPADEHIRAIANQAVRDAMPDVLNAVADAIHGCGFTVGAHGLREHATKLRKERGA